MRWTILVIVLALLLMVAGCSPGPNPSTYTRGSGGYMAGFTSGLWHGFIAPVIVIVSFFANDLQIYEVHNNGVLYNLGFVIGILFIFSAVFRGITKIIE